MNIFRIALFLAIIPLFMVACHGGNNSGSPKPNILNVEPEQIIIGDALVEYETEDDSLMPEVFSGIDSAADEDTERTIIYFYLDDKRLEIEAAENSSVDALTELLQDGDIQYTANDYGNFEKVGDIAHSLPSNDEYIDAVPGDVMLYQGTQICLYYGNNSWSFTRLGKIVGYDTEQLQKLLNAGQGEVNIRISLN